MFESLSIFPYIAVMHSEITDKEIKELLKVKNYQRSLGKLHGQEDSVVLDSRTSYTFHDTSRKFDYIILPILETVKSYTGHNYSLGQCEYLQLTRYKPGQYYEEHWDHFSHVDFEIINNDRIATVILYLNDDFTGGNTVFTKLGLCVTPEVGKICYFSYPPGQDATYLAHTGTPVHTGVKYIAQIWIRQKSWR